METTVGGFVAWGLHVVGEPPTPPELVKVSLVLDAPGWTLPPQAERRPLLATLPVEDAPEDIENALRNLARRGAVAVSLTGDASGIDLDAYAAAAGACGLVALTAPSALSSTQLAGLLQARQVELYRWRDEIRAKATTVFFESFQWEEGPERLLDYVQRTAGTSLDVITRGGVLWDELSQYPESCLDLLAEGRIPARNYRTAGPPTAADAAQVPGPGPWHVSLHALQGVRPQPVLYARAPGELAPHTKDLLHQTALHAAVLYEARRRGGSAAAEAANRAAVLQYLMLGHVEVAARIGERLAPGVFSHDTGRVAIIECGQRERREDVAAACTTVVDPSLIAKCPAYDRHLILALPGESEGDIAARAVLSQLAAEGRAIGMSTARPWRRTVISYQSAFRALAAARASDERIALNQGEMVAALLPPAARAWGRAVCARLSALPEESRKLTVHTAAVALGHGAEKAGKLMGIERTAAGARLATTMNAMGLRRGSLIHRAVADLALQLSALPCDDTGESGPAPDLAAVLAQADKAREWAQHYLAPLDDQHLQALTAWLAADGQRQQAATALGISRSSLFRLMQGAGTLLSRDLGAGGEAPHDPLWALLLTGHLEPGILPATTPATTA